MVTSLQEYAKQTLSLIDLTSLNDNDNDDNIVALCYKSQTDFGSTPAICIYSRFIETAKLALKTINPTVKIATVTNFPHGSSDIDLAIFETDLAIKRGADEVDIVFPYHYLKQGNYKIGHEMIKRAKQSCGSKTLKVIIESGELKSPELIKQASEISIENGADFIKTSTGKVAVNATLDATEIMLNAIKASGKQCGFKAAGGIRTVLEAKAYLDLTSQIMGNNWINSNNFRFGASGLLGDVLNVLNGISTTTESSSY